MSAASTSRNRNTSIILLAVCVLSAVGAVAVNIDDNLPGILLALLAAVSFILALVHPWRRAGQFLHLLLASIVGFVLFILLNIGIDTLLRNPDSPAALQRFMRTPAADALFVIIAFICTGAFLVGAVGALTMFIRGRRT